MIDYRMEWDKSQETHDEMIELGNSNTRVFRTVNKSIANTAPREFIDKKIWFKSSDVPGVTVDEGYNDIYLWITSVPDSLFPKNKKFCRADSLLGITRFGRNRDGKPGCFY